MATQGQPSLNELQAQHNEGFASQLADDGPFDWAVTVLFYSALHFVEHFLRKRNVNTVAIARQQSKSPHAVRSEMLEFHVTLADQARYRTLRQQSELARYLSNHTGPPLTMPAYKYFDEAAAKGLLNELQQLKATIYS